MIEQISAARRRAEGPEIDDVMTRARWYSGQSMMI
jgi:hypothetical protein